MRRTLALALTATSLLAIACSGSAPTSPSSAAVVSPSTVIALSTPPSLFGVNTVDFARCLQSSRDAACFAAARVQQRAVGAAPAPPINLSSSSSGDAVTLTWGPPASGDPVATYIIEAGSGPGLANLANVTTNSAGTSFSASGVGGGTYYVRVRAQNAGGTSAASNESILVVGSTGCNTAPNAPTGFAGSASGGTVQLVWSAPAGNCSPSSYVLQAGSSAGSSDLANANVGAGTSYVASAIAAGTYYVRVRAVNAYGPSAGSNEVVLTVTAAGGTPSPSAVTGRWVGVIPDGVIVEVDPYDQCPAEYDLQLDLTSIGTAVTGTATTRLRKVEAAGDCSNVLGEVATWSVINGSVGSGTISFALGNTGVFRFSGTFTATRMTGTVVLREFTRFSQTGSFALNRQ
jgi:predicted phage tail protein